jgi:hypothetical protein
MVPPGLSQPRASVQVRLDRCAYYGDGGRPATMAASARRSGDRERGIVALVRKLDRAIAVRA